MRTRLPKELVEASAVVSGRTRNGLLFAINDSGHGPVIFALDTAGVARGSWKVPGAANVDWEAAATGPCGPSASGPGPACLYIGDVGDNSAVRRSATIYRLPEPQLEQQLEAIAESVAFRYSDGPHDVEAMYVGSDGTMFLITKRSLKGPTGGLRPALVFRLPGDVWKRGSGQDSPYVAELVDSLPIVPGTAPGRQVTDAALSPDGRFVAVRTYAQVYVFAAEPESGKVRPDVTPSICNIAVLRERQGEAITWLDASGRLLLMSEGRKEPLYVFDCPLPKAGPAALDSPSRAAGEGRSS